MTRLRAMTKKKAQIRTTKEDFVNYSSKLRKEFTRLTISPGDRISFVDEKKSIEGHILEQNELGDPNAILIKMDNGYNIGIQFSLTATIRKMTGRVELESFPIRIPQQKSGLPEISLLATGGTIASRIDYQTGGVVMAMQPEEIFASLPELFDEVSFKSVKSLFSMGSEDMNFRQWRIIAEESFNELNSGVQGVVITHGTDIMGYSAAALSFMLQDLISPIIITGAQRSSDRGSYDGAINLISATRAAAKADIASVMICMHETSSDDTCLLTLGTKVRKMHTSRRDAFRPINDRALARIDMAGKITELQENLPRRNEGNMNLQTGYNDKVTLIKIFPGISPDVLDWYIDKGTPGVIIEGTGLGHVPTFTPSKENRSWIPSFERTIDEGIFVGMTSQCLYGRVHPFVYKALRTSYQVGVTFLQDMLPETALIKLGWTLGNYNDPEEIRRLMVNNLAGEINSLSKFAEFLI